MINYTLLYEREERNKLSPQIYFPVIFINIPNNVETSDFERETLFLEDESFRKWRGEGEARAIESKYLNIRRHLVKML